MYRRRRPTREIHFSFDSFLDVVANVVGIIIRLILVVWVSARAYTSVQEELEPEEPDAPPAAIALPPIPEDPLRGELSQQRRQLDALQARLMEQLRRLGELQKDQEDTGHVLAELTVQDQDLERQTTAAKESATREGEQARSVALTAEELRRRGRELEEAIRALEKLPSAKQVLRYRTPISHPVTSDELFFECRNGKVAYIDLRGLREELRREIEDKKDLLRHQWEVSGDVGPVGAFRLHYVLERERSGLDAALSGPPDPNAGFRGGLTGTRIEAVDPRRGETLEQAMQPQSEFRQVVDNMDIQQTAVTFWVYPDSFPVYRRLRDYLYDRDAIVAGRPLPEGAFISSSRQGTASRGQ